MLADETFIYQTVLPRRIAVYATTYRHGADVVRFRRRRTLRLVAPVRSIKTLESVGGRLYAVAETASTIALVIIDPGDGRATPVAQLAVKPLAMRLCPFTAFTILWRNSPFEYAVDDEMRLYREVQTLGGDGGGGGDGSDVELVADDSPAYDELRDDGRRFMYYMNMVLGRRAVVRDSDGWMLYASANDDDGGSRRRSKTWKYGRIRLFRPELSSRAVDTFEEMQLLVRRKATFRMRLDDRNGLLYVWTSGRRWSIAALAVMYGKDALRTQ